MILSTLNVSQEFVLSRCCKWSLVLTRYHGKKVLSFPKSAGEQRCYKQKQCLQTVSNFSLGRVIACEYERSMYANTYSPVDTALADEDHNLVESMVKLVVQYKYSCIMMWAIQYPTACPKGRSAKPWWRALIARGFRGYVRRHQVIRQWAIIRLLTIFITRPSWKAIFRPLMKQWKTLKRKNLLKAVNSKVQDRASAWRTASDMDMY